MASKVKPIPDGYSAVTPYLSIKGASEAIEFYRKAFDAREVMRFPRPDGRIGHAEVQVGDSKLMLADEMPEMDFLGPNARGGSPVHLHLYVEDVDGVVKRALSAGARELRPVEDQFYGDRLGAVIDPFGHVWHVSTHKEDVPMEELKKRAAAQMQPKG